MLVRFAVCVTCTPGRDKAKRTHSMSPSKLNRVQDFGFAIDHIIIYICTARGGNSQSSYSYPRLDDV